MSSPDYWESVSRHLVKKAAWSKAGAIKGMAELADAALIKKKPIEWVTVYYQHGSHEDKVLFTRAAYGWVEKTLSGCSCALKPKTYTFPFRPTEVVGLRPDMKPTAVTYG